MRLPLLVVASLLLLSSPSHAQVAAAGPSYDIAIIKPSTPTGGTSVHFDNTVLTTSGTTPRVLLQIAFHTSRDLIFGMPRWAEDARFDVTAKDTSTDPAVLRALTPEQSRQMLQTLLGQRFGLRWHFEEREVAVYELVYVRQATGLRQTGQAAGNVGISNGHMEARGIEMGELMAHLADTLQRPVFDHTGLKGYYDVDLRWRREDQAANAAAADDPNAPPILLTAVQEQLGLKLKSDKQMVPVLVVDQLTPPTAN